MVVTTLMFEAMFISVCQLFCRKMFQYSACCSLALVRMFPINGLRFYATGLPTVPSSHRKRITPAGVTKNIALKTKQQILKDKLRVECRDEGTGLKHELRDDLRP